LLLSVLIEKLKIDAGDDTIGFNTARRAFERAEAQINKDLGTSFAIVGTDAVDTTILPDPSPHYQELLLILAKRHLVGIGRIEASRAFSWKSGDKAVDRTRAALSATEFVRDLWAEYLALAGLPEDLIPLVTGEIYERKGGDVDWSTGRETWVT